MRKLIILLLAVTLIIGVSTWVHASAAPEGAHGTAAAKEGAHGGEAAHGEKHGGGHGVHTLPLFQIPNFFGSIFTEEVEGHKQVAKYIPEHVAMTWLIIVVIAVLSILVSRNIKPVPGPLQNIFEAMVGALLGMLESMIGHKGRKYLPLIGGLAFFILFSNLLGIVPGMKSPTANPNTTIALAVTVFILYHIFGMIEQGVWTYCKHFAGPVWWLAPLMVPVEVIGHFARPLSLSIRLFGNIFGEDMVIAIIFFLIPILVPLPMFFLGIFTSVVQTFVFIMLSTLYIAGAVESGHEEH